MIEKHETNWNFLLIAALIEFLLLIIIFVAERYYKPKEQLNQDPKLNKLIEDQIKINVEETDLNIYKEKSK